jgi:hypothetical protein
MAKIKQSAIDAVAQAIALSVHSGQPDELPERDMLSYRDLAVKFIAAWGAAGKLKSGEIFEPLTPAEAAAEQKAAEQAAADQKQAAADQKAADKQEAADLKQEAADAKAADKQAAADLKAGR